mmetsp:Transcript_15969/g.36699  ORF Transcript_15969/g.36699 Transcript_15969/m.36699 type:complete len:135 (-) Transcript_15969:1474-1878(-)
MPVAGRHVLILADTGKTCEVSPYSPDYKPMKVPLVDAVVQHNNDADGSMCLLVLQQLEPTIDDHAPDFPRHWLPHSIVPARCVFLLPNRHAHHYCGRTLGCKPDLSSDSHCVESQLRCLGADRSVHARLGRTVG